MEPETMPPGATVAEHDNVYAKKIAGTNPACPSRAEQAAAHTIWPKPPAGGGEGAGGSEHADSGIASPCTGCMTTTKTAMMLQIRVGAYQRGFLFDFSKASSVAICDHLLPGQALMPICCTCST